MDSEKEAELVSLENSAKALSKEANSLEASLMSLRSQVQEKFEEMKGMVTIDSPLARDLTSY